MSGGGTIVDMGGLQAAKTVCEIVSPFLSLLVIGITWKIRNIQLERKLDTQKMRTEIEALKTHFVSHFVSVDFCRDRRTECHEKHA